jgi:YNFM family putative membrane transporter
VTRTRLLLATLAAYLPAAALPALAGRHDLPSGPLDPAVLVVPFCLGFAVAFPFWGRAADRTDAGRVIQVALLLMAAAGVLVAFAPSPALLIAGRALQGLAAAGIPPAVQAELARGASDKRTGRALSGMMLAVALATLAGPAVAPILGNEGGWTIAALTIGCGLPLTLAMGRGPAAWGPKDARRRSRRRRSVRRTPRRRDHAPSTSVHHAPYASARGVHAGWLTSALVLAGHWTVLTRLGEALGPAGLNAGSGAAGIAALTGAIGLPLVVLAARASDAVGPRRPMIATLAAGASGFVIASTASTAVIFIAAAGVGLAVYWAYLPVVAAQVQRSAGVAARGRAAGGLYASMWCAAAVAGLVASLAPSWREVLLGAGVAWGLAGVVAAREFIGAASSEAWPTPAPQPSPR